MTIAGRINLLFVSAALVLAVLLTAFTAWREYRFALDRTVDAVLASALAHPALQFEIYRRDQKAPQSLLAGFPAAPPDVRPSARGGPAVINEPGGLEQGNALINAG